MKKSQFAQFLIPILMLLMWNTSFGQQAYQLSGDQKLTVSGTSSIHDWEMVAKDIKGAAQITVVNDKLTSISSLAIDMPVKSLKSGKGSMDSNTYEALEEKKYPSIKFEMTELTSITGNVVKVKGKLTIAGASKIIPLEGTYTVNGSAIRLKGKHDILFSDYNITPPTAVFGTIKTGNELSLGFEVSFTPKN